MSATEVVKAMYGNGCQASVFKPSESTGEGNTYYLGVEKDRETNEKCEWTDQIPGLKYNTQLERAIGWLTPKIPVGFGENGQAPFANDLVITITFTP
ncbi:hypothetical protein IPJ72_02945 [Candidatus Peregrinibacteria bacterium]|nr:MAG: hypothetical protein IPJ72_02945 [Candidatus Peregrinibacteria bacterium]